MMYKLLISKLVWVPAPKGGVLKTQKDVISNEQRVGNEHPGEREILYTLPAAMHGV